MNDKPAFRACAFVRRWTNSQLVPYQCGLAQRTARSKPVGATAHVRLGPPNLGPAHAVQFGNLDDPDPTGLHRRVLATQVRDFIGEPCSRHRSQSHGLLQPLVPFQN